ncbi:MAG: PASTA domain-containing protein [Gemmatimonadota bacterium]
MLACFGAGYALAVKWWFPSTAATDGHLLIAPDVAGVPVREAVAKLEALGLVPRVDARIHHPASPVGAVLTQNPLPEQFVAAGGTVSLTVSEGPESRPIPRLRGLSAEQASAVLARLGFEATTVPLASADGSRGGVRSSRPPPGQVVSVPSSVELEVAEGPQVAVVPALRGLHIDDVASVLESAGLQLGTVRFDSGAGGAPGRVVAQSPPAGYSMRARGFVNVQVAGRPGETSRSSDPTPPSGF